MPVLCDLEVLRILELVTHRFVLACVYLPLAGFHTRLFFQLFFTFFY